MASRPDISAMLLGLSPYGNAPNGTDNSIQGMLKNQQVAMTGPYVTKLNPQEEARFQAWVKQNRVPWRDVPNADYDMRGFYRGLMTGDPRATQALNANDGRMHFDDKWKTPFHESFSNESMYSNPDTPHWINDSQQANNFGKVVYTEGNNE